MKFNVRNNYIQLPVEVVWKSCSKSIFFIKKRSAKVYHTKMKARISLQKQQQINTTFIHSINQHETPSYNPVYIFIKYAQQSTNQ